MNIKKWTVLSVVLFSFLMGSMSVAHAKKSRHQRQVASEYMGKSKKSHKVSKKSKKERDPASTKKVKKHKKHKKHSRY